MSNPRVNDVLVRAGKTAIQTFLATLATAVAGIVDVATARAALIAALSAAISAAWNTLRTP